MKTLYVIRHAKSSWDIPDISDFDRPLNDRGRRDAPRMAKRMKERHVNPDLMLSSPATRALSTCKRFAEIMGYAKGKIKTDHTLYHANEDEILSVIRNVKDKHSVLMVFGHNPGLTDFVNQLSREDNFIGNLPTCGIVSFTFDVERWQDVGFGNGQFVFFDFPKSKED